MPLFKKIKVPRLIGWQIATVLLMAVIFLLAPQQLPVSLYKLSLVTMAGVIGYWLDRALFPHARIDDFMCQPYSLGSPYVAKRAVPSDLQIVFAACMIRRAIVVAAVMLAIGLGA